MDAPTIPFIEPEVWGRSFWEFLDAIVATYPRDDPSPEHRNATYDLLTGLATLLPCPTCRGHYAEFIRRHPVDHALVSRRELLQFYFLLKRDVAGRTRKAAPRSPDDLWSSILRRMRVASTRSSGTPVARQQPFRVPARVANVGTTTGANVKKGCNCGHK